MKHRTPLAALVIGMVLCPGAAADDIHKWIDAEGNVHFGDKPPDEVKSEVVTVRPNVYTTPSVEPLAEPLAANDAVVLYSTSWCGYCKKAREYFAANNIPFSEYDVDMSEKGRRDYALLGARAVPVILVGGKRLNGFSVAAFERLYREVRKQAR